MVKELCNLVGTVIKAAENIQLFKILLKTWDGTLASVLIVMFAL